MYRIIEALIALFVVATAVSANGGPSMEQGKVLFNSTSLGTNGKSCEGCHPNGKGLEESAAYDTKKQEKITNMCIVKTLKGKALADGSPELDSLVMYLKSLGGAKAK